jgi:chromosome partitioning protein
MKRYAVMTMKGGTGKTTTTVNIAHGLSLSGKRVLLIDCDPQRNVSIIFGVESARGLDSLLTTGDVDILQVRDNLFLIDSGGRRLVDVELSLGGMPDRESRLRQALRHLTGCDYVICDCPPSVNLINVNALAYCDEVIIPISMDYLAHKGANQTIEIIEEIQRHTGMDAINYHILPTFYDARTRVSRQVLERVREQFDGCIYQTVIRINTSLREAPGFNMTIFEHAPLSRGAFDYYRLTEEIIEDKEKK